MSNEAVFVAIGIACVVAVLLFIVFIIYCVKRHKDKEESRQLRQRRAREERRRRHLLRTRVVRPPPYDPNRQNVFSTGPNQIPVSPPPSYKEVATPLPRNRNWTGIGDLEYAYGPDPDRIPTVTRNVAPMTTIFNGHFMTQASVPVVHHDQHVINNSHISSVTSNSRPFIVNNNDRGTHNNQYNSDHTIQVRPLSASEVQNNERAAERNRGQDISYGRQGHVNLSFFQVPNTSRSSVDPLNLSSRSEGSSNTRDLSYINTYPRDERGSSYIAPTNRNEGVRQLDISLSNQRRLSNGSENSEDTYTLNDDSLAQQYDPYTNRGKPLQDVNSLHKSSGVSNLSLV